MVTKQILYVILLKDFIKVIDVQKETGLEPEVNIKFRVDLLKKSFGVALPCV